MYGSFNFLKQKLGSVEILMLASIETTDYCNVQPSQATETPSVEKHAHPPRVVYCAIYLTLTLITKFRVSNLHITTR